MNAYLVENVDSEPEAGVHPKDWVALQKKKKEEAVLKRIARQKEAADKKLRKGKTKGKGKGKGIAMKTMKVLKKLSAKVSFHLWKKREDWKARDQARKNAGHRASLTRGRSATRRRRQQRNAISGATKSADSSNCQAV